MFATWRWVCCIHFATKSLSACAYLDAGNPIIKIDKSSILLKLQDTMTAQNVIAWAVGHSPVCLQQQIVHCAIWCHVQWASQALHHEQAACIAQWLPSKPPLAYYCASLLCFGGSSSPGLSSGYMYGSGTESSWSLKGLNGVFNVSSFVGMVYECMWEVCEVVVACVWIHVCKDDCVNDVR